MAWQRVAWDGTLRELGDAWRLEKGSRSARCAIANHPYGGEIRLTVGGEFVRSEAFREHDPLLDAAAEWKAEDAGRWLAGAASDRTCRKGERMIAAIYARKSTDQAGVADEAKSVARQIEHARAYATAKGWTVDESCTFVDDGISGAEFANRPGFLRLMNSPLAMA
jgi:hypothetical protein